jgi:MOSC domain-containing protein YiiM
MSIMPKVISLNVGLPRVVESHGEPVTTGIFKAPVAGAVMLRTLNLDGDGQADLSVHGGRSKAVYAYPIEHYHFWQTELPHDYVPDMHLPYGMFGENFTTEGMLEDALNVGDRFRVGEAELMVTEPRLPCFKLGIKFGRADIIRKFLRKRWRPVFSFAQLCLLGKGGGLDIYFERGGGAQNGFKVRQFVSRKRPSTICLT